MEITLEMVERLREKAHVSYGLAKEALEYSGGNLLDALIYLEEKGAIPREEGAYYSTRGETSSPAPPPPAQVRAEEPEGEKKGRKGKAKARPGKKAAPQKDGNGLIKTLRRWLIDNELEIWRKGTPVTALPVLILLLLLIFAYYVVIPLLVLGLFLGFRYRFSGPDLERDGLNNVMGTVADTAADLGRQVMDELRNQSREKSDEAEQVRRAAEDLEREAADLEQHVVDDLLGGEDKRSS